MLFTSPTNLGLITGLFVVFPPLADRLFFGTWPSRPVLVAVLLSLVSMVFLAGGGPPRRGEYRRRAHPALCLHIALLSRYAAGHDAGGLAFVQLLSMVFVFGLF